MDYSDNPNFVLSIGGFHPRFTPPPLPFPSPNRLALSIIDESFARIRIDTYFAITTNSRAARRARRGVLRVLGAERRGQLRLRRAAPVLAVLLDRRDLVRLLRQGLRPRRLGHPAARLARGTDAVAHQRLGDDLAALLRHLGRHRPDVRRASRRRCCRRCPCCRRCARSSRSTTAGGRQSPARAGSSSACASSATPTCSSCTRSARCRSASGSSRSACRSTRSATRQPSDIKKATVSVDAGRRPRRARPDARAVRRRAVPQPGRRRQAVGARRSSCSRAASSSGRQATHG